MQSHSDESFHLRALLDAYNFIGQQLQKPGEDINVVWSNLHPVSHDVKLQSCLDEAVKLLTDRTQPIPNVEKIIDLLEKVATGRSGCTESREILFLNPVSTQIAPGYYNIIKMPMCFFHIRLRLQANIELRHEISLSPSPAHRDILQLLDPKAYGSVSEQKEINGPERYAQLKKAVKFYNDLERKPRPYETVDEVLLDIFLIACNCMYFNQREPDFQRAGHNLILDAIDLLRKLDVNIPEWIVKHSEISAAQPAQEQIANAVVRKIIR